MVETASDTSTEQKYIYMAAEPSSPSYNFFHGIKPLVLIGIILIAFFPAEVLAKFVFNLLTTLPMAYFSLRVLMRGSVSEDGLKFIVFYWLIYGVFLLFDALCSHSFGYKLFKLSVLLFIAYNVTQCNLHVFREITGNDKAVSVHHPIRTPTSRFDSRSKTLKDISSNVSTFSVPYSDLLSSQQRSFPFSSENESGVSTAISRSSNRQSGFFRKQATSGLDFVVEGEDVVTATLNETLSLEASPLVESRSTVVIGDVVTGSVDEVDLVANVPHLITVVNCSAQNIMWALKSNVLKRLSASPACGVILSGATATIQVISHGRSSRNSESEDQVYLVIAILFDECTNFLLLYLFISVAVFNNRSRNPISFRRRNQCSLQKILTQENSIVYWDNLGTLVVWLALDYAHDGSVREYSSSFVNRTDKKRHTWTVKCKEE